MKFDFKLILVLNEKNKGSVNREQEFRFYPKIVIVYMQLYCHATISITNLYIYL